MFEGRANSRQINNVIQLINVFKYIHTNPIKHNLVKNTEDWEYSNYHECIGSRTGILFNESFIIQHFVSKNNYHKLIVKDCSLDNFIDDKKQSTFQRF